MHSILKRFKRTILSVQLPINCTVLWPLGNLFINIFHCKLIPPFPGDGGWGGAQPSPSRPTNIYLIQLIYNTVKLMKKKKLDRRFRPQNLTPGVNICIESDFRSEILKPFSRPQRITRMDQWNMFVMFFVSLLKLYLQFINSPRLPASRLRNEAM